jgi:hypothetical protein
MPACYLIWLAAHNTSKGRTRIKPYGELPDLKRLLFEANKAILFMKTIVLFGAAMLITVGTFAQNQSFPGNNSQQNPQSLNSPGQSRGAVNSASQMSNSSADQLATQLQLLRGTIEQTLPALMSFNQTSSNTTATAQPSTSGGIVDRLGGLLKKNTNSNNTAGSSGQNSFSTSNIVSVLRGLVKTNNSGTSSTANSDASTMKDLAELQSHLEASLQVLKRLNVESSTTSTGPNVNYLSPTGR